MPKTLAQWTGVAVTAIVVFGSDMDLILAVPLGILAGALAAFLSGLPDRAGPSHVEQAVAAIVLAVVMPSIDGARFVLAKVPHVRAFGACVLALFVGMWIGSLIEAGRAMERESTAIAEAKASALAKAKEEHAREVADLSEELSQSKNQTKRQLDEVVTDNAIAIDTYRRDADDRVSAVLAQLEREQRTSQNLLRTYTMLALDYDNLLQSCGPGYTGGEQRQSARSDSSAASSSANGG